MQNTKCKICRRLGVKLFLKGDRCLSPKCPIIKRPYPPGQKKKKRPSSLSEYGKELREKQKLRRWYNLDETQFRKYAKKILNKKHKIEDAAASLIKILESRLDNVVFRLGFASSRDQARQIVNHSHFLVNNKAVNIPSFLVKKGDKISLNPVSSKKNIFKNLKNLLKKHSLPKWLELNVEKLEGTVIGEPTLEESAPPADVSVIFEYYSR